MVLFFAVNGIKDIRPPLYFKADYRLLIVFGIIILLVGVIFLACFLFKKIKMRKEGSPVIIRPAHEIAYEALRALKAKNLPTLGKMKQYYFELSLVARHYIEDRFRIAAPEMTTEEFLFHLRDSGILNGRHKNLLKEFLNLCDIVKFAKYGPTQKETDESFDAAKRFVDETKESAENSDGGLKR